MQTSKNFCLLTAISALALSLPSILSSGTTKRWLPDVDWTNPDNWESRVTPSPAGIVEFPLEMGHTASLPRSASLSLGELRLPRDGILALPEDGSIQIEEPSGTNPPLAKWAKSGAFYWTDPSNWNSSSIAAMPHLERLPCSQDSVILPAEERAFSLVLPRWRVRVKDVRPELGNASLSSWRWDELAGDLAHSSSSTVGYSLLGDCESCGCQDGDLTEYLGEVCEHEAPRCPHGRRRSCARPLGVEGHCCEFCGGRIVLARWTPLKTMRRIAEELGGGVSWYPRTTWDGGKEVLIAEDGEYEGGRTLWALERLERLFAHEGHSVLETEWSGEVLTETKLIWRLVQLFGGLVGAVMCILVVLPIFGYSYLEFWFTIREALATTFPPETSIDSKGHPRRPRPFRFARFDNVIGGSVRLSSSSSTSPTEAERVDVDEIEGCEPGKGIENPLYEPRRPKRNKGTKERDEEPLPGPSSDETLSLSTLTSKKTSSEDETVEMIIEEL